MNLYLGGAIVIALQILFLRTRFKWWEIGIILLAEILTLLIVGGFLGFLF